MSTSKEVGGNLHSVADFLSLIELAFPKIGTAITDVTKALNGGARAVDVFETLLADLFPNLLEAILGVSDGISSADGVLKKFVAGGKAAFKGLWAVVKAHPFLSLAAAIGAVVWAIDHFTESMAEAKEKADKSRQAYEEQAEKVKSLNQELETTKQRIEELEGKPGLTLVEQDELNKLKAQNALLEQQIALEKTLEGYRLEEAARDANNYLTKKGYVDFGNGMVSDITNSGTATAAASSPDAKYIDAIDYATGLQKRINALREEQAALQEEMAGLTDEKEIQKYQKRWDDLESHILDYGTKLSNVVRETNDLSKSMYTSDGEALSGYENTVSRIDALNEFILDSTDKARQQQKEIDDLLARPTLAKAAAEAKAAAKEMNGISLDTFKAQFPDLAKAAEEAGIDIQNVVDTINSSVDAAVPSAKDIAEMRDKLVMSAKDNHGLWNANWIRGLSDDEIQILYSIVESRDTGAWSFEDFKLALSEAKEQADEGLEVKTSLSGEELTKALDAYKSAAELMRTAQAEMTTGGGLSAETAKALIEKLTEAGEDYVDYLTVENGALKLNTKAFGDYLEAMRPVAEEGGLGSAIFEALDTEALKEVFDAAAERVEKLHKALDSLADADTLDYDTFNELSELLPNVAGQITDVESAQAALTAAIANAEDVVQAAYGQMLYANQAWVSGVINSTSGLANALASYYGKDTANWKDAAQNKWNVDSALVKDLSGLWAKYYNVSNQELEAQLKTVKKMMDGQNSNNLFTLPGGLGVNVPVQTQRAATTGLQKTYNELQALLEMRKAAEKSFSSLDFTPSGSGSSKSSGSSASSKTVEEYIADIDRFREALERLRIAQEQAEDIQFNIDNSDNLREQAFLSRTLAESYEREREALTDLRGLRSAAIEENAAKLRALGFEVSYNAEKDQLWIANMEHINDLAAASAGEYDSLAEATNAYRKEVETLISDTEEMNDENRENSDTFRELGQSVKDTRQAVYDYLDSVFDKMSETVDEMQSLYDQLHTAADEYAQSGYITIDTLQGILAMGPEYLAYLMDENGMLTINEEKIRDVIAARTQQMAVETALSYVEALHVANANGDIETLERLLYATEQATDATWGLVYANLELTGLDSAQKAAALERINAMRALADSAVQSIGQTNGSVVEDLQKMQDGLSDILKYVMEMIKHEIQEQIDAIERMKDAYSDYIDEKKEALDLARDEANYEKDKAKRLQEMAKLQARIDALSLDDSREAQAERASLLEEMAGLQDELNEKQSDKAIETQKDALDQMDEDFSEAQDKKITALEESISSEEKLYRLAIERIQTHWDTLYDELINWNTEYGTVLNQEITDAWENCLRAAQRYGDYVSAMKGIESDMSAAQSQGTNLQVGRTEYDSSSSGEEKLHSVIHRMYENTQLWHTQSDSQRKSAEAENDALGRQLNEQFGIPAWRGSDGVWYVGDKNSKTRLYDMYAKYTKFHTGGIVGGGTPKENEEFALLQKKEWVLTRDMVKNLTEKMKWLELMGKMAGEAAKTPMSLPRQEIVKNFGKNVSNVVNNDSHPIEITFGGTTINGTVGKDALDQHAKVDRRMVNEIARLLRIKT